MRKLFLTFAVIVAASLTSYAQLPGVAFVNSFNGGSGTLSSSTSAVAEGGLISLYPTNAIPFNVPNLGTIYGYEANSEVRIVHCDGSGNVQSIPTYFAYTHYVSPTQINVHAEAGYYSGGGTFFRQVQGGTTPYIVVQRKISGVWQNVSNPSAVYMQYVKPSSLLSAGTTNIVAALYCSFDGALLKLNVSDGTNNPRTHVHSGTAYSTILAFYLGDCDQNPPVPPTPSSYPWTEVKLNNVDRSSLKTHNYPINIGAGLWQQNVRVPSIAKGDPLDMTGSVTIQFGLGRYFWQGFNTYGNTATIPNWVQQ